MEQQPKFISFGDINIDRKKYNGGKLQFRTKNGNSILNLKSVHMSPNIKLIVEKLLSNTEIPYNDVDKLNETEREILANIAHKAGINDRLKIPTPKLTQQQADINRFYVLQGELQAGNDAKELIKELKLLLVKLMGNSTISKPEGSAVLHELLLLGF